MAGTPSLLVRRVLRAGERLRRVLDQCYTTSELNGPRVDVLETIATSGPDGCSQTELAIQLEAAESSVSTIVERMRRDGLLLRMRSRIDRRCSVLLLTELGNERLSAAINHRDRQLAQWIGELTSAEQRELTDLLDRLLLVLSAQSPTETSEDIQITRTGWGNAA